MAAADAADAATATQIAHDFDAGLRAVWSDLEADTRESALAIARDLAQTLDADGIDVLDMDVPYPEQLAARQLLLTSEPEAKGLSGKLARLMPNLSGVSMVSMLGHLLFAHINPFAVVAIGSAVSRAMSQDRGTLPRGPGRGPTCSGTSKLCLARRASSSASPWRSSSSPCRSS